MPYDQTKEKAHELIDRMAPSQLSAVVGLLESMLDPVSRAIANAPIDDEPESDLERKAVAASKLGWRSIPVRVSLTKISSPNWAPPPKTPSADWNRSEEDYLYRPGASRYSPDDRDTAMRILTTLHRFAETGQGDIKKLQGDSSELRLRVAITASASPRNCRTPSHSFR